jgi:hypothetical protein
MADISRFSVVTFQRRPGYWRASVTPKVHGGTIIRGRTLLGFITEYDCASEQEAESAAHQAIKKL